MKPARALLLLFLGIALPAWALAEEPPELGWDELAPEMEPIDKSVNGLSMSWRPKWSRSTTRSPT